MRWNARVPIRLSHDSWSSSRALPESSWLRVFITAASAGAGTTLEVLARLASGTAAAAAARSAIARVEGGRGGVGGCTVARTRAAGFVRPGG